MTEWSMDGTRMTPTVLVSLYLLVALCAGMGAYIACHERNPARVKTEQSPRR